MIQTIDFRWRNVPFPYRCEGSPYPRVGFSCRDRDGNCTRTDVEKLTERQRSIREFPDGAKRVCTLRAVFLNREGRPFFCLSGDEVMII